MGYLSVTSICRYQWQKPIPPTLSRKELAARASSDSSSGSWSIRLGQAAGANPHTLPSPTEGPHRYCCWGMALAPPLRLSATCTPHPINSEEAANTSDLSAHHSSGRRPRWRWVLGCTWVLRPRCNCHRPEEEDTPACSGSPGGDGAPPYWPGFQAKYKCPRVASLKNCLKPNSSSATNFSPTSHKKDKNTISSSRCSRFCFWQRKGIKTKPQVKSS